jgi:hypothetical protein
MLPFGSLTEAPEIAAYAFDRLSRHLEIGFADRAPAAVSVDFRLTCPFGRNLELGEKANDYSCCCHRCQPLARGL